MDCQAGGPLWQRRRQAAKAGLRGKLQTMGQGRLHGCGSDGTAKADGCLSCLAASQNSSTMPSKGAVP
eukprot:9213598-Lingulodinium_polyedra.AAC.1